MRDRVAAHGERSRIHRPGIVAGQTSKRNALSMCEAPFIDKKNLDKIVLFCNGYKSAILKK